MAETLDGVVDRIAYHDAKTGFCVLRIARGADQIPATVVGRAFGVHAGASVQAEGEWVDDRQHGRQFKASEIRVRAPRTIEGIEKYLASGMIKGVGPEFAARLVGAFGEDVFDVIEKEPSRLREVPGIGRERQRRILEAWGEQRAVREIMVFLHSHGVGTARAAQIYRTYGQAAIQLVRENPYRLSSEIHGIGFRTADEIARRLGIEPTSLERASAGVVHVLEEMTVEGHCAAHHVELLARSCELLGVPRDLVESALERLLAENAVVRDRLECGDFVYLPHLYRAEVELARRLTTLRTQPLPWSPVEAERAIPWAEQKVGIRLGESQRRAVREALASKILVITGGPGVGKTTIIRTILTILRGKGLRCSLCAPTGRAARRLSESSGHEAKTIHRLLEFNPARRQFRHDRNHPLDCHYVILDEASMVDLPLMRALLDAVPPWAGLIIVGDVDQLPSVGPGQILADLIASDAVPVVRLTEIFRQAAESRIVTNAHRILKGEQLDFESPGEELGDFYFVPADDPETIVARLRRLVSERIPQRFGLDPIRDVQVLVPMNRSPLGSRALNEELQNLLNPRRGAALVQAGKEFRRGDKVMQIKNDYEKEVFNGDIGFVREIEDATLVIDFDGRLIRYSTADLDDLIGAYATTIHKSQGSEYPAVVLVLHTQHYILLQRNLLYTAVTRGRRLVVIVGSRRALALALKNAQAGRRNSGLRERLARGRKR